jgi:glycosyltransferase involved in cell wall biosynthesis
MPNDPDQRPPAPTSQAPTSQAPDDDAPATEAEQKPIDVAILIDPNAFIRLKPILRHLCIGLIDHKLKLRVIAENTTNLDGAIGSLGPVQTFTYSTSRWPFSPAPARSIAEFLAKRPPSILYAVGGGVYKLAASLADECHADLAVNVTTFEDVILLHQLSHERVGCVVAASTKLANAVQNPETIQIHASTRFDSIALVRPGVLRGEKLTCFQNDDRIPSFVCNAPLDRHLGVGLLIEAAAILRDKGRSFLFFLLSEGPEEGRLRKLVRDFDLEPFIVFARATAKIADILRGADIFLLAPGEEEISARPLQAMASGTPVVSFSGGAADFLHDGETAVVCKDRTPIAIAAAVETLLLDHARAGGIAENAIKYVKANHQMTSMADLTYDALKQVVFRRRTFRMPK